MSLMSTLTLTDVITIFALCQKYESHSNVVNINMEYSVERQVRSLFQTEFTTEGDLVLPLSISNILFS